MLGALLAAGALYLTGALAGRSLRTAGIALGALVAAAVALALLFTTQAHRFDYPDKVGLATSIRGLSGAWVPAVSTWAPFPASVATTIEGVFFVALALAAASRGRIARGVWTIGATTIGIAVIATASRGAWIGMALAMLVAVAWRWRGWRAIALAGAIVVAAATAPLARADVHAWALALIGDAPFTGVGLGGFEFSLSKYVLLIQVPFLSYAHNLYLDAWLQQGLAGVAALVWLTTALVASIVTMPSGDMDERGWWQTGCWLGVLTILLHGATDARPYVDPWSGAAFFVMLGVGRGLAAKRDRGRFLSSRRRSASLARLAAIPALTAAAFVGAVIASTGSPRAAELAGRGSLAQAREDYASSWGRDTVEVPHAEAEALLAAALQRAPNDASAHYRLGLRSLDREAFADAREHLQAAFDRTPNIPGRRKAFGLSLVWTGDVSRAASLLGDQRGLVDELNTWGAYRTSRGQRALAAYAYATSLRIMPEQDVVLREWQQLVATLPNSVLMAR